MAATLNLFPARIRFVNSDGTLTPEALRVLSVLSDRVGGPMGDNGVDVFGDLTGAGSQDTSLTDTVTQHATTDALHDMLSQPTAEAQVLPDVVQPVNVLEPMASGGAAPAGGVGTAAGAYDTAGNRDAAITLLNNIRTALIAVGIMK